MFLSSSARRGLTLVEVLMAMFVMAIGMLALLVLFPVGLINVRWAIDNNRIASIAHNANAVSNVPEVIYNTTTGLLTTNQTTIRNDASLRPDGTANYFRRTSGAAGAMSITPGGVAAITSRTRSLWIDPLTGGWTFNVTTSPAPIPNPPYAAIADPNFLAPIPLPYAGATPRIVFPPVFVDPQVARQTGWRSASPAMNFPYFVGAATPGVAIAANNLAAYVPCTAGCRLPLNLGIPRVMGSAQQVDADNGRNGPLTHSTLADYFCEDEVGFARDSLPGDYTGDFRTGLPASISRDRRFTTAYVCRWNQFGSSTGGSSATAHDDFCDLSMVLYNGRPYSAGVTLTPTGETSFTGVPARLGLVFQKGFTEAFVQLPTAEGFPGKAGDWIFDNTLVMPEYDETNRITAPYLDRFDPTPRFCGNAAANMAGRPVSLRAGLVGGHFYQLAEVGPIQVSAGVRFQRLVLNRPAKSDGFVAVHMKGVADVIEKGIGTTNAK